MTMIFDHSRLNAPAVAASFDRRSLLRSLLANVVAPAVVLTAVGASFPAGSATPLLLSALPPAGWLAWELVRRRVLDVISVLALGQLAFSIAAAALAPDLRSGVRIGALQNIGLGLLFAGSAVVGRPLVRSLARQFLAGGDAAATRRLDESFAQPAARSSLVLLTWVWAAVLLVAGLASSAAASVMDPIRFRSLSSTTDLAIYAALIWGSLRYRRMRLASEG